MTQAQQTLRIGLAARQHAYTVAPQHIGLGNGCAFLLARGPHQQFVTGDLGDRHRVGHKHHRRGAVFADDGFDQIQARRTLAKRDIDIARLGLDELAGGTGQIDVHRWRDGLRLP